MVSNFFFLSIFIYSLIRLSWAHTHTDTCLDNAFHQLVAFANCPLTVLPVLHTLSRTPFPEQPFRHGTATTIYQHREFITMYHRSLYRNGAETPISPFKIALYLCIIYVNNRLIQVF